jgi:predicted nucleic acid-binding protein
VRFFLRRFTLLADRDDLLGRWHTLVRDHQVTGVRSFDARIVAAMQTYGIIHLMTFNTSDFKSYPITIVDPTSL